VLAIVLAAWAGLLAGALHVLMGVDHLAALVPLSVGQRGRAALLGARWGIGHGCGVVVVGVLAVLLQESLDLEALGSYTEGLVGATLVGIGALGLRRAFRMSLHAHEHTHDGETHVHLHVHGAKAHAVAHGDAPPHAHSHAAFFTGVIHGTAGMSHLLGVLPAVALGSWALAAGYLGAFALGSIGAMAAFAGLVGTGTARLGTRAPRIVERLLGATSAATILLGCAWLLWPAMRG
jgi:hypothetical protein